MSKQIKTVQARWIEGMEFKATTGSAHHLTMDAGESDGGKDHGPRPMEMLLVGMAGCTGMDVVDILRKNAQIGARQFLCVLTVAGVQH